MAILYERVTGIIEKTEDSITFTARKHCCGKDCGEDKVIHLDDSPKSLIDLIEIDYLYHPISYIFKSRFFILDEISRLKKLFKEGSFKYDFKLMDKTHIIEVMPLSLFVSDEFIRERIKIRERLNKFHSGDGLLFISENSLNKIGDSE